MASYKGGEGLKKPSQKKNLKNLKNIAIHHSATPQSWTIHDFVNHRLTSGASGSGKYSGLGYNYVVLPLENRVVADVPEDEMAWSVGGYNSYSLSICVAGYYHAPVNNPVTENIINMLVDKCAELCAKHHLDPMKAIIGHRDVANIIHNSKWATSCPGDLLYAHLNEIRTKVKAKLDKAITPHSVKEEAEYDPNHAPNEDWGDMGQHIMH
jgi:hypothetical protein